MNDTPTAFTFGDAVKSPVKSSGEASRMNERRTLAANIVKGAAVQVTQVEDGHEFPVTLTADVRKRHTPAQVSRAINDTLGEAAHAGPFYARYDKGSDSLRIVKGKRPRRKSEAKSAVTTAPAAAPAASDKATSDKGAKAAAK